MSKEAFEDSFREALSKSFQSTGAPEGLRKRLLERLSTVERRPLPDGVDEGAVSVFQERFSLAVHRSNDWSPEEALSLRVEAKVGAEIGRDCFSERSVGALVEGAPNPSEMSVSPEKLRFVSSLRGEIRRSSGELKAPETARRRIEEALRAEARPVTRVVPFPTKAQWKRGLSALTTLAAGFALVFITLFGSTDVALANTVRRDHKSCCRWALDSDGKACQPMSALEGRFGSVPKPRLDSSWKLMLSQVCHGDGGRPMIHMLYSRPGADGLTRTLSLHFIPDRERDNEDLKLKENQPSRISDDGFPVLGWREGDWICTACSPDLGLEELSEQL